MTDKYICFTVEFEGDIRDFEGSPLTTHTPFGVPSVVSLGSVIEERDELASENAVLLAALRLAWAAMEHMGDALNALDAVSAEDVALTTPAFEAIEEILAKAEDRS